MSAREDLLFVAASLAAQARVHVDPPQPRRAPGPPQPRSMPNHDAAVPLAHAAKAALEAAQLVDADPAPIIAATERLHERLAELGEDAGLELAVQFGAAEAIDAVVDVLDDLHRQVRVGAAVTRGYVALRELLEGLERDFSAAETETAKRIAARIHGGLEAAEQDINTAKGQEDQGG